MNRVIRKATPTDLPAIMLVIDAAKGIMRSSGNMNQWTDGYPSEAVILSDMEKDGGFVIEDDGRLVAYFAFLPSPEPTYAKIYGEHHHAALHRQIRIHLLRHHLSCQR